jgi:hypothetical protein
MKVSMVCKAQRARRRSLPVGARLLLGASLLAFFFSAPAAANTSVFTNAGTACTQINACRALSDFGMLTGLNDVFTVKGNTTFNGGVGINQGSDMNVTGANTYNGILDFSDTLSRTTTTSCAGSVNICGNGTINGQTTTASTKPVQNAALISAAYTQFVNIESYIAGLTANSTLPVGTNINVEASGTGIRVFDYTTAFAQSAALTFGCGATLTALCSATDLVIIRLTSTTTASFNFSINLAAASGLTSDQVIFYIPNSGATFQPTAAATTLNANFFFGANSAVTIGGTSGASDPVTLAGRMYGATMTFNNKGFTQSDLGDVPEPGTWAMFIGGAAMFIYLRRRRAKLTV